MTPRPIDTPDRRGDRLGAVDKQPLTPTSLVGSFFHFDAERSWQGCVAGEVTPGIYLVELFEWVADARRVQRLVRLDEMINWQFYIAEWMNNAYENRRRSV